MYGVAYFMLKVFNKCNGVKIIFITLFSHYSFNTIKTQMTNKRRKKMKWTTSLPTYPHEENHVKFVFQSPLMR